MKPKTTYKDDDLIGVQEAAKALAQLGVKRNRVTVGRWLNAGEIPFITIMNRRYIRYGDLKAYVGKEN